MTAPRPNILAAQATMRAKHGRAVDRISLTPRQLLIFRSKRASSGKMRWLV